MRATKYKSIGVIGSASVIALATVIPTLTAPAGASSPHRLLSAAIAGGFVETPPFLTLDSGLTGTAPSAGATGSVGATGSSGTSGTSGAVGSTGATGATGTTGAPGFPGAGGHHHGGGWGEEDGYGSENPSSAPVVTWQSQFDSTVSGVVDLSAHVSHLGFGDSQTLMWCVSDNGSPVTTGLTAVLNGESDSRATAAGQGCWTSAQGRNINLVADTTLWADGSHSLVMSVTDAVGASATSSSLDLLTANSAGPSGAAGVTGSFGVTGSSGDTGSSGATGVTGYSGATGVSGTSGVNGATGPSGDSGVSGPSGF